MQMPLNRIVDLMKKQDIDIVFLNNPRNVFYVSSYMSDPHERILAAILFKDEKPLLFTPALEENDAKKIASEYDIFSYLDTENPWEIIVAKLQEKNVPLKRWAIEKDFLTVERLEALKEAFPSAAFDFNISTTIQDMRLVKNPQELAIMKKAGYWADQALQIGAKALREGITEAEVVAEIEYQMKRRGISEMSFDTMVLFGENAASPHGTPGEKKLQKNQFVLFDLGVMYEGYASDVTRTLFFGDEPTEHQKEIYNLVLSAHDEAMAAVRVGMKASALDAVARNVIAVGGYGKYFNHRLGHGLGQGVHEFPSIMEGNDMEILDGMCFSIEPGIYLPGDVGVRVEDCGYASPEGFVSFTETPTGIATYLELIK
ncbi:Hypothetical protein Tpal_920 [Trichococcus palustris]|jgi:Xaa-Pro dipeptidase|uniref:Peptidase m24 methionine aminopeptidase n=1 Tax=Trichococcus palustris TaxID=140314 RepID=A0A143YG74_9LACT|nr:Xaa-Pro peptidase family protein [Trichococcus palustris]CZQ87611.1 Hypothetical protein Tpal_920 [Trichococcus palustris]SFK78435.1 Xaa-Pro dipeptidase [Trichococcus palustris]